MKKILALMLALVIASVSFFALGLTAFADPADGETSSTEAAAPESTAPESTKPTETEPATNGSIPNDPENTTKPTEAPTQAPTQAPATQAPATQAPATQAPESTTEEVVTLPEGATNNINDPNENGTTKAPSVPVDTDIPNTGSGIVVPALALLALAGGVAVAVKSKKD